MQSRNTNYEAAVNPANIDVGNNLTLPRPVSRNETNEKRHEAPSKESTPVIESNTPSPGSPPCKLTAHEVNSNVQRTTASFRQLIDIPEPASDDVTGWAESVRWAKDRLIQSNQSVNLTESPEDLIRAINIIFSTNYRSVVLQNYLRIQQYLDPAFPTGYMS
jgi:hypothetical protein